MSSSTIRNSQKVEIKCLSMDGWVNKSYPHHGLVLTHTKERSINTYYMVDSLKNIILVTEPRQKVTYSMTSLTRNLIGKA